MELLNKELEGISMSTSVSTRYSNYKFYFINNADGVKEVKKIFIYDDNKVLLEMNKPWFNNVNSIEFDEIIRREEKELFDGSIFYIETKNKKQVQLYIPNKFAKFEKIGEEDANGLYKKVDVYRSKNEYLNYHVEKINTVENDMLLRRIKNTCLNAKNKEGV